MIKVNDKGESVFTRKIAALEQHYNPNFAAKRLNEIIEFYRLFKRYFCQSIW